MVSHLNFSLLYLERFVRMIKSKRVERRARLWMDWGNLKATKNQYWSFEIRFVLAPSLRLASHPPPLSSALLLTCFVYWALTNVSHITYMRWTRMGNENKLQNIRMCHWERPKNSRSNRRREERREERNIKQTAKQTDLYTNNHVNRKLLLPYRLSFFSSSLYLTFMAEAWGELFGETSWKSPQNITHSRAHTL